MFQVGDYIVYGKNGVCRVEDIGTIDTAGIPKDTIYYTLYPNYSKGSKIFTPVDNNKVFIRPVITKEEAFVLIDQINEIEILFVADEKRREMDYKEALSKCKCIDLVRIIKTIYLRQQSKHAEGKKLSVGEDKYYHMAEDNLYGELAIALKMDKDKVKEFIVQRLDLLDALQ